MGTWSYRTSWLAGGERFAVRQTWGRREVKSLGITLWHVTPEHTYLFTFKPTKKYNKNVEWTEELCREAVSELRSPQTTLSVVRFAVDGQIFFETKRTPFLPKLPDAKPPEEPGDPERKAMREAKARFFKELEAAKQDPEWQDKHKQRAIIEGLKGKEPAPYVLYGKYTTTRKEYAWWLSPDKVKRQGIVPGDRVLVWTKHGFAEVTVTRIEPAAEAQIKPTARVKRKLQPGEKVYRTVKKESTT